MVNKPLMIRPAISRRGTRRSLGHEGRGDWVPSCPIKPQAACRRIVDKLRVLQDVVDQETARVAKGNICFKKTSRFSTGIVICTYWPICLGGGSDKQQIYWCICLGWCHIS